MKKLIAIISAVCMCFAILSSQAYAFPGYGTDEKAVVAGFADEYGWDIEKINEDKWIGFDGEEYERPYGHQAEFYEDQIEDMEYQCFQLGIIDSIRSRHRYNGDGALKMVAVARGELGHDNRADNRYGSVTGMGIEQPWCCSFISWCASECGFIESGLFANSASCANMSDYLVNTNGFHKYKFDEIEQVGGSGYSVVPGDVFIFSNGSSCTHIALIAEVTSDSFTTIEGLNWISNGFRVGRVDMRTFSESSLGSEPFDTRNGWAIHVEYPSMFMEDIDVGSKSGREMATYRFFREIVGLNDAATCGIMGNIESESGFNPLSEYHTSSEDSYGICQWNNRWGFWDECQAFCNANGFDPLSLEGQLYYTQQYATSEYEREVAFARIRALPNTPEGARMAAEEWCRHHEKPGDMANAIRTRQNNADTFWSMYAGMIP